MIKRENFIMIEGWMKTELNLNLYEMLVYALIYGFSQDGKSEFAGSSKYICEWYGFSRSTVARALASLEKKGLLRKSSVITTKGKFTNYAAIVPRGCVSQTQGLCLTDTRGCVRQTHHKQYTNTNKKDNKRTKKNAFHNFEEREYSKEFLESLVNTE